MSIIAVAAVGVIAVFLAVQLKGMKGEYEIGRAHV